MLPSHIAHLIHCAIINVSIAPSPAEAQPAMLALQRSSSLLPGALAPVLACSNRHWAAVGWQQQCAYSSQQQQQPEQQPQEGEPPLPPPSGPLVGIKVIEWIVFKRTRMEGAEKQSKLGNMYMCSYSLWRCQQAPSPHPAPCAACCAPPLRMPASLPPSLLSVSFSPSSGARCWSGGGGKFHRRSAGVLWSRRDQGAAGADTLN